jgi:hypothetical protein
MNDLKKNIGVLPEYCDFSCRYAEFGDPCAVGACRRDVGVWCTLENRFNNKHARCLVKQSTEMKTKTRKAQAKQ